jgi:hypothetical protein
MRPVRINLTAITETKFVDMMMKYFPSVDDTNEDWLKKYYAEMSDRYYQVIIDLDSGEVMQAFLPDGTWALSKFYLDCVPTPNLLDENGFPLMLEAETEFDKISDKLDKNESTNEFKKEKEIILDEKTIDKILDKIAKHGRGSLSIDEELMLTLYVKKK